MPGHPHRQTTFYGIVDTGYIARSACRGKCQALLDGGAGIVQLRAKNETREQRAELVEQLLPLFDGTDVPFILNDDLELASRYPNVGIHVGQDDAPVTLCRKKLGPDRVIGLSTHSAAQVAMAIAHTEVLSYFAIGPVFATPTKPTYPPVGPELLRHVVKWEETTLPWYAIGGIHAGNAGDIAATGAPGLVSVSSVLQQMDTAVAVKEVINAFTLGRLNQLPL